MSIQDKLQAAQYAYPYHHLPRLYHWHHQLEYEVYLEYVVGLVRRMRPKYVLDVGCGDGRFLKELGYGHGLDLNPQAVDWAIATGVQAFTRDARDWKLRYNLVTAIEVLEHIPPGEEHGFIQTLCERSMGKVLLTVPSINVKVPAKHYRHYDSADLLRLVSPFMHVERLEWIVSQPWWWSALERIPSTKHEKWLKRQLKVKAGVGDGRHLLVIGSVR